MAFDQARHDELAKKDPADLSQEEALELALLRSEVSLAEYDPQALKDEAERVVELPDHASSTLGEVAKDESLPVSVRVDAQSAVDNPPPNSPVYQDQMQQQVAASAPGAADTTPAPASSTSSTKSPSSSSSTDSGSSSTSA
jgi:hypothetical protein